MTAPYVLVVDDEPDIRELVKEILEDEDYRVVAAENGHAAREALREGRPDLILLDIWMPDVDGITLLKEWAEDEGLPCPVIMMSGHGTVETAVEATRLGAYDFLEKPLSLAKLLLTVERALEADRLARENIGLRKRSQAVIEPVGRSAVMQRLREQVKRLAQHDTWVLISGEPGSGRETFARYLHAQSVRRDRPFVEVAVNTIAAGNAARDLFGSETDGHIHYGRLEQASGGTLFLDEIADMDAEAQRQLVGALDTGSFVRVSGSDPVKIDVRIIAATSRELAAEVQARRFREDLFYQLNVVPLRIPPLREHHEDTPDLLSFYVDYFAQHEKLPYRRFVENAMGGVSRGGAEVPGLAPIPFDQPLREAREQFEKVYLEYQLEKHAGNVSKMAIEVGMERTHLYRKLRSVGIEIKERR